MTTKPRGQSKRKAKLFSLESLYTECFEKLVFDLTDVGSRERAYGLEKIYNRRAQPPLSYCGAGHQTYKVWAQLENFHKRLIFPDDTSFEELSAKCLDEFAWYQSKSQLIDGTAGPLIEAARAIVDEILGDFSMDKFADLCLFSKKAAYGLTRANSYLDKRIERLNGTSEQINLFNEVRSRDIHLLRATRHSIKTAEVVNSIKITSVPKSWKAARIIAPDTTIGGFLSTGLGAYLRDRLEASTPINLAVQQDRHKRWACEGSRRGHLATIDMSKASDSFMPVHISMLMDEKWAAIVNCMRTPMFHTDDVTNSQYLASVMLMGSGHTFPLQTILFYALAKATCDLLKIKGIVSVYGDDIIVPNAAAQVLTRVFSMLGFSINTEKSAWSETFVHSYKFRESCGGDYVNGYPVRPWMPERIIEDVRKTTYVAEIHKLLNGVNGFWHPTEVPGLCDFLLKELDRVCTVTFVPDFETETSGIRMNLSPWLEFDSFDEVNFPYHEHGVVKYLALRVRTKNRTKHGRIHYWNWLKRKERKGPHRITTAHEIDPVERDRPRERAGTTFGKEAVRGGRLQYRWTREGGSLLH